MPIFSGEESKKLWKAIWKISKAKKKKRKKIAQAVFDAIYLLGCKCQELEKSKADKEKK